MNEETVGRALSKWMILWGSILLVLVSAATVWLLLAVLGDGTEADRARLDTLKTAGSVVLGTGGAVALLLAARRQRSTELDLVQTERDLVQKERVQQHAEQVAAAAQDHHRQVADDARFDATQRRITDLYSQAADQLGSERAPLRLAGLYSLERLAQDTPDLRQTVVSLGVVGVAAFVEGEPRQDRRGRDLC